MLQPGEDRTGGVFPVGVGETIRGRFDRDDNPHGYGTPYTTLDVASVRATVQVGTEQDDGSITWAEVDDYDLVTVYGNEDAEEDTADWFDALQLWREDSRGYNFAWHVPAEIFTTERTGKRCRVIVLVSLIDGDILKLQRWEGLIVEGL